MLIPKNYTRILQDRGRSLHDIGVHEIGLKRSDALEAVKSLEGSQVAILGGDVLQIKNDRPEYCYDNWYCNQSPPETLSFFLRRSWETAENFVKRYPDPEDGSIL